MHRSWMLVLGARVHEWKALPAALKPPLAPEELGPQQTVTLET
jgi:hypothetical protein